uniref:Uncharacterized protein n=1 Tax=Plectus sambesii TaxID=2011161 RepID=A0A914V9H1_9BILA
MTTTLTQLQPLMRRLESSGGSGGGCLEWSGVRRDPDCCLIARGGPEAGASASLCDSSPRRRLAVIDIPVGYLACRWLRQSIGTRSLSLPLSLSLAPTLQPPTSLVGHCRVG